MTEQQQRRGRRKSHSHAVLGVSHDAFNEEIDDDAAIIMEGEEDLHNGEAKSPRTRRTRDSSMNSKKGHKRSTEENKPASSPRNGNGKKESGTTTPTWRRESVKSHHLRSNRSHPLSPSSSGISIGITTPTKSQRSLRSLPKFSPTRNSSTSSLKRNNNNKSSIRTSNSPHATATPTGRQRPATRHSSARPQRHSSGPLLSSTPAAATAASLHRRTRSSLTSPVPPIRPPFNTSPIGTRRKVYGASLVSPVSASSSPRRKVNVIATRRKVNGVSLVSPLPASSSPLRKGNVVPTAHNRPRNIRELSVTSLSPRRPKRTSINKSTCLHASLSNFDFHHHPPSPSSIPTSPLSSRSHGTSNLSTSRSSAIRRSKNAPPPPQTTLQRLSIKLNCKAELKAEKKAREEKLMQ